MEETIVNLHLEVNELHHSDFNSNKGVCMEIKNVAVTAEEISEDPEYIVLRKSIAVQTITNEEVVFPKQDPALDQRPNLIVSSSEGGSTMEMDISSQESVMDIASQESLSVKESNSEEPHFNPMASVTFREKAVLAREEAVMEYEGRLKKREEYIANHEKAIAKIEMEIEERQKILKIKEQQIIDRETAVKIRELEADGYRVINVSNKSNENGCLPAKRPKKN